MADRYRGQFKHWDVDNEALHNTYFSGRLGPSIQSWMYAMTQELDPSVEVSNFTIDFDSSLALP